MHRLFLVSASLMSYPAAAAEVNDSVTGFIRTALARDRVQPLILCPDGLDLGELGRDAVRYGPSIRMEASEAIWRPLAARSFDRITVLGTAPLVDYEEIVIACFLSAGSKSYLDAQGGRHDIAGWERDIRPDYRPSPLAVRCLNTDEEAAYIGRVHAQLGAALVEADFGRPRPVRERDPDLSLYTQHRLAKDIAQLTSGLQVEAHDAPFSILKTPDGSIVQSADYHRACANFVSAIDGVEDILDLGCGSGFLSCHLAASGKYRRVLGVDSAQTRIDDARLHADLIGSTATFAQSSMVALDLPDKSFDLTVTSYALEQSGARLSDAIRELCRVTRRYLILFEPTGEYFSTVPGLWHIGASGWANTYFAALDGLNFAVRPNLLSQYYNPSAVFVIDLSGRENPVLTLPHLFRPAIAEWPGGVRFI